MRIHSLGPHTFFTPPAHERHHDWLHRFKPRERHEMIADDSHARMQVFAVMVSAMLFGLSMLLVAVLAT